MFFTALEDRHYYQHCCCCYSGGGGGGGTSVQLIVAFYSAWLLQCSLVCCCHHCVLCVCARIFFLIRQQRWLHKRVPIKKNGSCLEFLNEFPPKQTVYCTKLWIFGGIWFLLQKRRTNSACRIFKNICLPELSVSSTTKPFPKNSKKNSHVAASNH